MIPHKSCTHSRGCDTDSQFDAEIKGSPALQDYFARLEAGRKKQPRRVYARSRRVI